MLQATRPRADREDAEMHDKLVRHARELLPLLRKNAAQTEKDRRVVEENIQALAGAGLFRVMQARRYGGFECSVRTHIEVCAVLAEACPSTSWVVNLLGVCTWFSGLLPGRAQDEIFGRHPEARIAGVFTPSSQTHRRPVDGGMVVSGKWYYASGSLHADWGLIGLTEQDGQGAVVDQFLAYVPMKELTIEDTWFTVGMRGSGSNCLVARDVFVPDHRMYSLPRAMQGDYATEHDGEVLYRSAFAPLAAAILAGPQLGMARAALAYTAEMAGKRGIAYTVYERQADSVPFQVQLAEIAMMVDGAHLHVGRAVDDIDRYAESGRFPEVPARLRMRCDVSYAIAQCIEAINRLVGLHGSGGFAEASPLQRWWRDANTGGRHAVALPLVAYEMYGKSLLGVEGFVTPIV